MRLAEYENSPHLKAKKNRMADESDINTAAETEFKANVKEYVALEDELKMMKKDVADATKQLAALKNSVIRFMHSNQIGTCNILGGTEKLTLSYKAKTGKKPNKEIIQKRMIQFLKNEEKALDMYEHCYQNEPAPPGQTKVLKRSMTPLGKSKKKQQEEEQDADDGGSTPPPTRKMDLN